MLRKAPGGEPDEGAARKRGLFVGNDDAVADVSSSRSGSSSALFQGGIWNSRKTGQPRFGSHRVTDRQQGLTGKHRIGNPQGVREKKGGEN